MCDVKINIVTSVEIGGGYANDYHYFKGLVLARMDSMWKEVSADKAYLAARICGTTPRHHSNAVIARIRRWKEMATPFHV